MNNRYELVVVGAGVAGLSLAALLAQSSAGDALRITLLDGQPRPASPVGQDIALRVSAIARGSVSLLESVGAWSCVDKNRIAAYDAMRVWDESSSADGGDVLRFDAAEFAEPQLGFIVENAMLQTALLEVLRDCDVEILFDTPIESLELRDRGPRLLLKDGRKLDADLVIGADGARSRVRECAAIATENWPYEQSAFVTHLETEQPHRNMARQRFLTSGPLGMLPLNDGRISAVWSTTPEQVEWAMSADDEELGQALSEASDFVLGDLTVAGPRGAFPLQAQHARDYVKAGIALIGDAAHAVHPLAGQGANLGLQDAACLADVLTTALQDGAYPGDRPVLRRYERARKGANATMLHFMTGLNRLFATDSVLLKELLTTGMRLFNQSGPIREHVVSVALGTRR
ncbi:MAG: UbiH/UbiF/VisC/COQ6 family ubiquinone biosynthesis hydroxylase [Woeseiaceae bacterium]